MATQAWGQNCQSLLLCPPNVVADCQSPQGADVPFTVNGTNTCFPNRVVCLPPSGAFFPVGTNRVCCDLQVAPQGTFVTVTQCCFEVVVRCPGTADCWRLVCPPEVVRACTNVMGNAAFFPAYATNTCNGSTVPVACTYPSGSLFPPGVTTNCCTFGVGATLQRCCFTVTVRDATPPVVLCPRGARLIRCAKPQGMRLRFRVTAFDECDTNLAVVCTPPSGSLFPPGTNVVTCCTTNDVGLTDCCSFNVVVLTNSCYLPNPSFELASGPHPPPGGNFTTNCIGWYQWTNTPDLLWGPFTPNNPFGYTEACHGSNYANIQGGYFGSGLGYFDTETLAGTFTVPLTPGRTYCLSACVSLADYVGTPGFHLEFFLANAAGVGQIARRITVTNRLDWSNVTAVVTATGPWDRILIRSYDNTALPYSHGACFFDNVQLCCCPAVQVHPGPLPHTVSVVWHGDATVKLLQADTLSPRPEWKEAQPLELEEDFDEHRAVIALPEKGGAAFFRTEDCSCSGR